MWIIVTYCQHDYDLNSIKVQLIFPVWSSLNSETRQEQIQHLSEPKQTIDVTVLYAARFSLSLLKYCFFNLIAIKRGDIRSFKSGTTGLYFEQPVYSKRNVGVTRPPPSDGNSAT